MKKVLFAMILAVSSFASNALTLSEYLVVQAVEVAIGRKVELHGDLGPFDSNQKGTFSYGWQTFERAGVKYLQLSNVKPEVAKIFNKEFLGDDTIKAYTPPVSGLPYAGFANDSKYFVIIPYTFLAKVVSEAEKSQKSNKPAGKRYMVEI